MNSEISQLEEFKKNMPTYVDNLKSIDDFVNARKDLIKIKDELLFARLVGVISQWFYRAVIELVDSHINLIDKKIQIAKS